MQKKLAESNGKDEMREAFGVFDRDKGGTISAGELKHVMNNLGETVTDEVVNLLVLIFGLGFSFRELFSFSSS